MAHNRTLNRLGAFIVYVWDDIGKLRVVTEGILERKIIDAVSERGLSLIVPRRPEMLFVTSLPEYVGEAFIQLDYLRAELQIWVLGENLVSCIVPIQGSLGDTLEP